jgi:CheY-like chemotaxis protein
VVEYDRAMKVTQFQLVTSTCFAMCTSGSLPAAKTTAKSSEHRWLAMRILVVDDWPDSAASWVMLLRLAGFDAECATDGRMALEMARARCPDVGIFDIHMPALDGYALARQIRTLCKRPLFLIAITARDSEEDRQKEKEAGFDLHLTKPAEPQKVLSLLAQALQNQLH